MDLIIDINFINYKIDALQTTVEWQKNHSRVAKI